jgi:hypothetical protein
MPGPSHHDNDMATHIVMAVELPKSALRRRSRFLEALLAVVRATDG